MVALFAVLGAWISQPHLNDSFASFFGPVPPALSVAALGSAALFIAPRLKRAGWWGSNPRIEALLFVPLLVAVFAASITIAAWLFRFPAEHHAPLPWSLLYYPTMGFAAQVGLHLIPLAALVWLAPRFAEARPVTTIALVSLPEAALQAVSETGIASAFVATHLLAFGAAELWLLHRSGFAVMYAFRMGYYLYWHILWPAWLVG